MILRILIISLVGQCFPQSVISDQLILGVSPDEESCNYLVLTCLSKPGFRRTNVEIISWFRNDTWFVNTNIQSKLCVNELNIPNSYDCKPEQHTIVIKSSEKEIGTEWKCQEHADPSSFATSRITSESIKTANHEIEPISKSDNITVTSGKPIQLTTKFQLYGHYNKITCFRQLMYHRTPERYTGSIHVYNNTNKVLTVMQDIAVVTEKDGGYYYCQVCSNCVCRNSLGILLKVKTSFGTATTSITTSNISKETSDRSVVNSTTVIADTTTSSKHTSEGSTDGSVAITTTVITDTITSSQNVSEKSSNGSVGMSTTVLIGVACGGTAVLLVIIVLVVLAVKRNRKHTQERNMAAMTGRTRPTGRSSSSSSNEDPTRFIEEWNNPVYYMGQYSQSNEPMGAGVTGRDDSNSETEKRPFTPQENTDVYSQVNKTTKPKQTAQINDIYSTVQKHRNGRD